MAAKPLTIGRHYFARQGDALEFFKKMLGRYREGMVVIADDAVDLSALLLRHARYAEKVGVGVDHFKVDGDLYGGKCFWIVRTDGSDVEFTYRRCVTGLW